MRINRDILINIAGETVAKRTYVDPGIVSAYLCGSVLGDDFLLGGTTDIDLVFIHIYPPALNREIIKVSDEIHLDIAHHAQKDYEDTRALRLHPWLGPTVFNCITLHDQGHFMDFTQASVRGQFDLPENVLRRVRPKVEQARQIWFSFQAGSIEAGIAGVSSYLKAIEHLANAIALMSGEPLTERRFLLSFPARAQALDRSGLYAGLLGLMGAPKTDLEQLKAWLPDWENAFNSLPTNMSFGRLHPDRRNYYLSAFNALLAMDEPRNVLWPLLNSWTLAVSLLATESEPQALWQAACQQLDLLGEAFKPRLGALDAYIDLVDETVEQWEKEMGL